MAIRIQLDFGQALTPAQRQELVFVLGVLAQVRRVVPSPDGRHATIHADDLPMARIGEILAEAALPAARIASTLTPEADAALSPPAAERVRAIGR